MVSLLTANFQSKKFMDELTLLELVAHFGRGLGRLGHSRILCTRPLACCAGTVWFFGAKSKI